MCVPSFWQLHIASCKARGTERPLLEKVQLFRRNKHGAATWSLRHKSGTKAGCLIPNCIPVTLAYKVRRITLQTNTFSVNNSTIHSFGKHSLGIRCWSLGHTLGYESEYNSAPAFTWSHFSEGLDKVTNRTTWGNYAGQRYPPSPLPYKPWRVAFSAIFGEDGVCLLSSWRGCPWQLFLRLIYAPQFSLCGWPHLKF